MAATVKATTRTLLVTITIPAGKGRRASRREFVDAVTRNAMADVKSGLLVRASVKLVK